MSHCRLCATAKPGFTIGFPNAETVRSIESHLASSSFDVWQKVDAETLWLDAKTVTKYADYWAGHLDPASWTFHDARRGQDGSLEKGVQLSWPDLRNAIPPFWIDDLISAHGIRMMAQPIVDVSGDRVAVVGYEMLARASDQDGKAIPPSDLFAQAREQERLFALDRECRLAAVAAATALPSDCLVFINFVPTAIYNPEHCLQTTMAATKRHGIDPARLVFEVVETEYVEDVPHLKRIFDYYKRHGVKCALDDVGAGFSDVAMLRSLAPSVIKLDRGIADGIATDREKQRAAQRILEAACEVGARALAEGIERTDDALCLSGMGYVWQQGYLYGKPGFAASPSRIAKLAYDLAA